MFSHLLNFKRLKLLIQIANIHFFYNQFLVKSNLILREVFFNKQLIKGNNHSCNKTIVIYNEKIVKNKIKRKVKHPCT